MGQILSLPMALAGLSWVVWILLRERRERAAG
jgi:prolipoprotein diacylglyceryltransferase